MSEWRTKEVTSGERYVAVHLTRKKPKLSDKIQYSGDAALAIHIISGASNMTQAEYEEWAGFNNADFINERLVMGFDQLGTDEIEIKDYWERY